MACLREKLPSVFRINVANSYWKQFREIILHKYQEMFFKDEDDKIVKIVPKNLTNIPEFQNIIYHMNIAKRELKKTDSLTKCHKFINSSCDSGLISRQEAVSMIPPILMQVKPGHKVLDMCAAPGNYLTFNYYYYYSFININFNNYLHLHLLKVRKLLNS